MFLDRALSVLLLLTVFSAQTALTAQVVHTVIMPLLDLAFLARTSQATANPALPLHVSIALTPISCQDPLANCVLRGVLPASTERHAKIASLDTSSRAQCAPFAIHY